MISFINRSSELSLFALTCPIWDVVKPGTASVTRLGNTKAVVGETAKVEQENPKCVFKSTLYLYFTIAQLYLPVYVFKKTLMQI